MKRNIFILSIIVAVLVFSACNKDWLEMEPVGKKLESNFYSTEQEAYQGLMSAYDVLQAKYYSGWSSYYFLASFPSDESSVVGGGTGDRPEYWEIDRFETTATNSAIFQLWRRNYYGIYRANLILDNVSIESATVDQMKAEAKFVRAYFYFELVRFFGDVPLITSVLTPTEYDQSRTPVEEVYAQIEQDLLDAIPLLPKKSEQSAYDYTRASKGAAQALLGKAYLFQEKFDEAAGMFKTVIESSEYGLEANFDDIWKAEAEFGVESIFEIPYSAAAERGDWGNGRINEGNIDVQMSGYRGAAVPGVITNGWGFDMVNQELVDAFDAEGDAVRKDGTTYGEDYLTSLGLDVWEENEDYTGWFSKKRAPWAGYNSSSSPEWTYSTNERMMRLADVKLMYAEALNRSGSDDATALKQVNDVRERASLPALSGLSGDALFQRIKTERQLELAMEGKRFFDLVRWGDAASVLGKYGFQAGTHEVFPIPEEEIINSHEKLIQNEGY